MQRLAAVLICCRQVKCKGPAIFCGTVTVFAPATRGSWQVFLFNGLAFASLFVILKRDIFAYLFTLSLSLMAYDWVKASTSAFTQDIMFYLVIATGVLGMFFLLPYVKKLVDRLGLVPMISMTLARTESRSMPSDSRPRAATPSPSCISPSRMCSVPM